MITDGGVGSDDVVVSPAVVVDEPSRHSPTPNTPPAKNNKNKVKKNIPE